MFQLTCNKYEPAASEIDRLIVAPFARSSSDSALGGGVDSKKFTVLTLFEIGDSYCI